LKRLDKDLIVGQHVTVWVVHQLAYRAFTPPYKEVCMTLRTKLSALDLLEDWAIASSWWGRA